jgi:ketosteroid isomerase-like protein
MKAILAAAFALALIAFPAFAHDPAQVAEEVRQADLAFARRALEAGPAKAFAEFMDAEEGLMFGGPTSPTKGREAIYAAFGGDAPSAIKLEWVPTAAWGSRGGDMGVTTGEWRRTPVDTTKPVRTGRYVTVWRKNPEGQWRGLVDIGETDETPKSNAVGALPTP